MAKRIQRKRTKGWRMPENTVYVGRGTKWGNPHKVGVSLCECKWSPGALKYINAKDAVDAFKRTILWWINYDPSKYDISKLKGKNLACWCSLDKPCHADILLELANEVNK